MESVSIFYYTSIDLLADTMFNCIFHQCLQHHRWYWLIKGVIKVISDFKGDYHELVVQNTGQLNGSVNTEGFGIPSTTNRLNLLYGDKASFAIKQINGSLVEAKVLIPVEIH